MSRTLDPQAVAFLEAGRQAAVPPIHQLSVADARQAGLAYLGLQRPVDEAVEVEHRFISGPTADLPVRIYRPASGDAGPTVLMLHGSGWVICNLDVADVPARRLAVDSGLTVVTVNYQKAPEHPYPVPLDDCYAALEWMVDSADSLGIDPQRIAVVGDSAGGNLAAAVALRARERREISLAAQALLYPALDARLEAPSYSLHSANGISRDDMAWFWAHYLGPEGDPDAAAISPLRAGDLSGLAPAFIATASHDVLRDEGEQYAELLREAGVPVEHREYAGMIHGFFWMDGVLDRARDLQLDLAAFLRRTLGG
ncbi:alpha/beta hydrolase fold domain-containing protein [Epidermidibacterium keratini]|uniref:Alpha/beta hydrolase fold domain-containing protein n=1 Tax=Epidermidibacterium keratini TaxID=1891644 RepID=A0A7L4YM07_9ACTN|nr:alpha/beta hydrolase [Epidermidibacterium keratini]QHC00170.1 alpha/beta hydrolase fold domain-containing protein [Epidermidibacterium keratini]